MSKPLYDVVVVGGGPAGSVAALILARAGARVALVDTAAFPRDKACGDLVGPLGLALLSDLGLTPPPGRPVGEMIVLGPTGRRVVLPARAGQTYPIMGWPSQGSASTPGSMPCQSTLARRRSPHGWLVWPAHRRWSSMTAADSTPTS